MMMVGVRSGLSLIPMCLMMVRLVSFSSDVLSLALCFPLLVGV
jgi:hypothetical protein